MKCADDIPRCDVDAFSREQLLFKLEIEHLFKSANVMKKQLTEYSNLEENIEEKIRKTKENIEFLQGKLTEEQKIREHRSTCEQLAADVERYPSRSILKRKIDQVESSISNNESLLQAIEADIQQKRTQFDIMLQSISQLQKCIIPEEDKEKTETDAAIEETGQEDDTAADGDTREGRKLEQKAKDELREAVTEQVDADDATDGNPTEGETESLAQEAEVEAEAEDIQEPEQAMDIEAGEEVE